MELQFNKSVLTCLRYVTREIKDQEQTQEVRLPDGMPDIGQVLASWGQLLIRGKEWRSGGMSVNGGVMVWVLYAPEEGGQPQCVETWLPFQMKWDFADAERDGAICVLPLLRGVDARSVSARKLMVRAGISILGEAAVDSEAELYIPDALPEDIQLLKNTYPLLLPREAGEKAFLIDEVLPLPASMAQPDKLIRYDVHPVLTEQRVMGDKVIFRGTANLHILYLGTDGQLHTWDFEMPFSQYAELEREHSADAVPRVTLAVTSLELDRGEEDNFVWRTGLTGQYVIYDRCMVELVEDAYSPNRRVVPQTMALTLPSVLDMQTVPVQPEKQLAFDGTQILDTAFYPEHPRLYTEAEQITAELGGMFQMLGYDASGELTGAAGRWEENRTLAAAPSVRAEAAIQPAGKLQASVTGDDAVVRGELPMEVMTVSQQGLPMVTGLEIGEQSQPDPDRPSLILRRAGEDSLWELAKQTGSTVEGIRKANDLQQDPPPNQMLLIPVQ